MSICPILVIRVRSFGIVQIQEVADRAAEREMLLLAELAQQLPVLCGQIAAKVDGPSLPLRLPICLHLLTDRIVQLRPASLCHFATTKGDLALPHSSGLTI